MRGKIKNVVWFAEVGKGDIALVGGKGANLGEMTNAGLPVPPGFIITSEAYYAFIRANKLDRFIQSETKNLDPEDSKKLNLIADHLQKAIKEKELPKDLISEIKEAYKEMHGEPVAVRSSATAEDLPDASFAGQQATFLNIEGEAALIKAVRECWASLFGARAIYYRTVNKFDHMKVGIAVPVQKMVQSEVSGIMFTVDPVGGDTSKITIDAGLGLGEAIVSGSVTPDHYVVNKSDFVIDSKEIAPQAWQIVRDSKGRNVHKDLTAQQKEAQKLTDEQIIEIAKIGAKVEEHYGAPQDTEWAYEDGVFYMVQSRPVTTLKGKDSESAAAEKVDNTETTEKMEEILRGAAASVGIKSGPVKIIHKPSEIDKVLQGDVLVTEMTNPDFVPAMRRAAAIVTDTGGRTCFTGKTKILTNRGFICIDEVSQYLAHGDKLMTPSLNNETLKIEWKRITHAFVGEAKTIKVGVSQTGRSKISNLEVTSNHRFLTLHNRQLVQSKIADILNGEYGVLSPTYLPGLLEEDGDTDLGYLLGAIGTDGSVYRTRTHGEVQFIQKNVPEKHAFIGAVRDRFEKVFNYEMRPHIKKASTGTLRGRLIAGEAMAYRCYSKAIAYKFADLENSAAVSVLNNTEEFGRYFIGGALDGDGTVGKNRLNFYSAEPHIYEPFIIGCLRAGISPQVCNNRGIMNVQISEKTDVALRYCQRLSGNFSRTKFGSRLFNASQLLRDVIDTINYKGRIKPYVKNNLYIDADKLQKFVLPLANSSVARQLKKLLSSDLKMLRANYVGEGEKQAVYNITVQDNHNYIVFTDNYTPVVVANSHAAIVSRELGIPCVVGTGKATSVLKTGQVVTVDGAKGAIYKGKVALTHAQSAAGIQQARLVGSQAVATVPVTATKVYLNLAEPEKAEEYSQLPVDGVGLLRAEFIIAGIGEHPKAMMADGRGKEYAKKLSQGISTIAQAFHPRPVVYRFTDFKSNEYKSLKGGEKFEESENNPMIGYRGASRYIADPEEFALEVEAIKMVRDGLDLKNLHVMIPFVRTVEEFRKVRELLHQNGLKQSSDFKLWIMCEVPSTVLEIEKYIDEGIDGVSIGSNDLTQLTLGIDRDSAKLASEFDERYPAVMASMIHVIKACRKAHITCSICGQAPSVYSEVTEALVKAGITSVSVAPDVAVSTRKLIASVEQKVLLSKVLDD